MAFKSRFVRGLIAWQLLVLMACFALVWSLQAPDLGAVRVVSALACVGAAAGLWNHVRQTNLHLARFIEAIRFGDLSQSFAARENGSGFDEVADALNDATRQLREQRDKLSDSSRFFEAVLDDAPTALLIVDEREKIELANKAARRLFAKHAGVRIEDFEAYGGAFATMLRGSAPDTPQLVPLHLESVPQTAMVRAAVVHRFAGLVRVVAVQPIQSELNAIEIAAQSDLIRVLTHEIMNSVTPVTSLAHTAAALVAKADDGGNSDIVDARVAVETLANRADGVLQFVEKYRRMSRTPTIRVRKFELGPWSRELADIFAASGIPDQLKFDMTVDPQLTIIEGDPDLLFQVLINLLRNAADAASGHSDAPVISLIFRRARHGRTEIEISDNGPGVPESIIHDVFLPFFTTKGKGSGIGLSLARQIVLAHHGSIAVDRSASGGAAFRLII